jgi:hypothetical protein
MISALWPPTMQRIVEQRAYRGFFDWPRIPVGRRHRDARGFVQHRFIESDLAQRRRRAKGARKIEQSDRGAPGAQHARDAIKGVGRRLAL